MLKRIMMKYSEFRRWLALQPAVEEPMLNYPVSLTPDSNGTILVGFADIPGAHSVGDNHTEALVEAMDALETALEMYIEQERPVPLPSSSSHGEPTVTLGVLATAKILLWNEMRAAQVTRQELAKRLDLPHARIDHLFSLSQPTAVELIERAAIALGKRVDVSLA
jgi:antitoxin HicB